MYTKPKLDEAGLIPAIIQDASTGLVLMLGYMSEEALAKTCQTGDVWFYSRSRQALWQKGEASGNVLKVREMYLDCDQDALLIKASPMGPTCHTGIVSCFHKGVDGQKKEQKQDIVLELLEVILERKKNPKRGSYTTDLFAQGKDRIVQKFGEEAIEVIIACLGAKREEICGEMVDLVYHFMVLMVEMDISCDEIKAGLQKRRRRSLILGRE